eukprot:jgi/Mesvir1/15632/Mv03237-RA.1
MAASRFSRLISFWGTAFLVACVFTPATHAAWLRSGLPSNDEAGRAHTDKVVGYWTPDRRAEAIPREFYVDRKGLAHLANGTGWEATTTSDPLPADIAADINVIGKQEWSSGGRVQTAVGRLYFEMPNKKNPGQGRRDWAGYVCSGTVVTDSASDRSLILTAGHCVYEETIKHFARNVLFIPNQAAGGPTDADCSNDIIGCWAPVFGVVELSWAGTTWPNNLQWDYAFYVVPASRSHRAGRQEAPASLEEAAGSLTISFDAPDMRGATHAIGYSYADDPKLMYCANRIRRKPVDWWLPECGLTGGASGGPWIQMAPEADGWGSIVSVNSWKRVSWAGEAEPGMAGPQLSTKYTTAKKLFEYATEIPLTSVLYLNGQGGSIRS